jgi:hypothetical protein
VTDWSSLPVDDTIPDPDAAGLIPVLEPPPADLPYLVESGWTEHVQVGDFQLLFYADGTVRFAHLCNRGERGVVIAAPALQLNAGHHISVVGEVRAGGLVTVEPSILCPDCGTHGFVRDGVWVPA